MRNYAPGRATVARDIEAAARPAAEHRPGVHLHLPHPREEHGRVLGIDRQSRAAGVWIDEEHALPALSAVCRAENAALLLRPSRAAERTDEDDIWISGVNDDPSDATGLAQSDVLPRRARVGG